MANGPHRVFLCIVFLLAVLQANGSEGQDAKNEVEVIDLNGSHSRDAEIQLTGNVCNKDTDCSNGGFCQQESCHCLTGTSGDRCEIVDVCGNNDTACVGDDVRCVYDVVYERAVCKCSDVQKKYDYDSEECRLPCLTWGECGENGMCQRDEPDEYGFVFCECKRGASGDRCEIIDQCHSKEVDCGDADSNAACLLGGKGNAYCKCKNEQQGFDYDNKTCRDCECGKANSCMWKDGKKSCPCSRWGHYFDGDKCLECNCGYKSECSFVKGKKVCECPEGFSQQGDQCKFCYCGSRGSNSNCTFEGMKKLCDCKPHYAMGPDEECVEMCNSTHPCQNGGTCDTVCRCPKGISGRFCERVNWCAFQRCGDPKLSECLWDPIEEKGECRCRLPHYIYDSSADNCIECDCGINGNCSIGYGSSKNCKCEDGYKERKGKCEECDCGHGKCCFEYYSGGKRCDCDSGYRPLKIEGEERCTLCDCGLFASNCQFGKDGKKMCDCQAGFAARMGKCRSCDCRLDVPCNYGNGWNDTKFCNCSQGYKFNGDFCEDVDECEKGTARCGPNMKCVNTPGSYECECEVGFEPLWNGDGRYGCQDIDECKQPFICEYPSTECRNTVGSYQCVCRDGFKPGPEYETGRLTRFNWCYSPVSHWKIGSIVIGTIFGIISAVLLVAIIIKRYRAQNR